VYGMYVVINLLSIRHVTLHPGAGVHIER
jgi:hypothetical protein